MLGCSCLFHFMYVFYFISVKSVCLLALRLCIIYSAMIRIRIELCYALMPFAACSIISQLAGLCSAAPLLWKLSTAALCSLLFVSVFALAV